MSIIPEEIEKIRQMTALRDQKIWEIAQGKTTDLTVDDSQGALANAYRDQLQAAD